MDAIPSFRRNTNRNYYRSCDSSIYRKSIRRWLAILWSTYGLWGRGKNILLTFLLLSWIDMCAREGCSHHRKWHDSANKCIIDQCECLGFVQNEIYTNWGIYKDSKQNHNFTDVNAFLPHCHPLRLDEFLEFEPISEEDREKFDRKIGIDEPYAWGLDSRKSQSYYGIESSSQIFQHRKTVGGIMVCTQLPSRVDKGIRETQDDFFFAVKPNDWGFHYVWFGATTYMMHLDRNYVQETVWPHYNHKEKIKPYFLEDFNEEDLKSGWKEDQEMVDKAISTTFNHMIVDMKGVRNVNTNN